MSHRSQRIIKSSGTRGGQSRALSSAPITRGTRDSLMATGKRSSGIDSGVATFFRATPGFAVRQTGVQWQSSAQHSVPCWLDLLVTAPQHAPAPWLQQDLRSGHLDKLPQDEFCWLSCPVNRGQKRRISPVEHRQAKSGVPLQAVSGTNARIRSCRRIAMSNC